MTTGLEPFFPLIIAAVGSGVVSTLGVLLGRKLGLTPAQAKYVETLEGLNDVLSKKIGIFEKEIAELESSNAALAKELGEARGEVAAQRQEVFELRSTLYDARESRKPSPSRRKPLGVKNDG